MPGGRKPSWRGVVALLWYSRDGGETSRRPTYPAFCALPPRIWGTIIQRGIGAVKSPAAAPGTGIFGYVGYEIGGRGARQKTGRLDIPPVHSARRRLLLAAGFRPPAQRRPADVSNGGHPRLRPQPAGAPPRAVAGPEGAGGRGGDRKSVVEGKSVD